MPSSKTALKSATSSAHGAKTINDADRERYLAMLDAAGLPPRARKLTRADFGGGAAPFLNYISSPSYSPSAGGICLSGPASVRGDLLMLMAKTFALAGKPVFFCTLHSLIYALDADETRRAVLARTEHLFIDWFEKDTGDELPYSFPQRMDVEDFLSSRFRAGRVTNFSACRRWQALKWWSKDFIEGMQDHIIDITVS